MLETDSTLSIAGPEDFFGGALKTVSMKLWVPNVWSNVGSWTYSDWLKDAEELRIVDVLVPNETSEEVSSPAASFARYVCHLLIDRLPNRAIPELCESMGRIYEFYRDIPEQRPALPLSRRTRTVRIAQRRERPPFHVEEEG